MSNTIAPARHTGATAEEAQTRMHRALGRMAAGIQRAHLALEAGDMVNANKELVTWTAWAAEARKEGAVIGHSEETLEALIAYAISTVDFE